MVTIMKNILNIHSDSSGTDLTNSIIVSVTLKFKDEENHNNFEQQVVVVAGGRMVMSV